MLAYAVFAFQFVIALAFLVAAIVWRRPLLLALPFLTILNGLTIPVGGSAVRIDQLAACLLAVPLGISAREGFVRMP
jgi:hypothetical protein